MKKFILCGVFACGLIGSPVRGAVKDWEAAVLQVFPEFSASSSAVQNSCRGLEANQELGRLLRSSQAKKLTDWSREVVMLAYLDYWRSSFKKAALKMQAASEKLKECSKALSAIQAEFPEVQKEWLGELGQVGLIKDWRDLQRFMAGESFEYFDSQTGETKSVRAISPPSQTMPELSDLLAERARQYLFMADALKQYIGQHQGNLAAHIKSGH